MHELLNIVLKNYRSSSSADRKLIRIRRKFLEKTWDSVLLLNFQTMKTLEKFIKISTFMVFLRLELESFPKNKEILRNEGHKSFWCHGRRKLISFLIVTQKIGLFLNKDDPSSLLVTLDLNSDIYKTLGDFIQPINFGTLRISIII